jgi:hypothetical protein
MKVKADINRDGKIWKQKNKQPVNKYRSNYGFIMNTTKLILQEISGGKVDVEVD